MRLRSSSEHFEFGGVLDETSLHPIIAIAMVVAGFGTTLSPSALLTR